MEAGLILRRSRADYFTFITFEGTLRTILSLNQLTAFHVYTVTRTVNAYTDCVK